MSGNRRYRDERADHPRSPPSDYRRRLSPPAYVRRQRDDSTELKIKGASSQKEFNNRDVARERRDSGYRRERSPSPKPVPRRLYRDRDREGYRSVSPYARDRSRDRSRNRSPPRYRRESPPRRLPRSRSRSVGRRRDRSPFYGGPPSKEVILEGLPPEMAEEDVSKELIQHHSVAKLDDVRVIRDRHTKASRCFGFIRFPSLNDSKTFVEPNYPTISFYGHSIAGGDGLTATIRIAYSRERDERGGPMQPGDWRCKNCQFKNFKGRSYCYQCQSAQYDSSNAEGLGRPQYANSGDSDVSPDGTPSQFLIIRGLEPTVTEDLLARGVSKLFKPSVRQSPPVSNVSKKNSTKIQSTTGDANLGAKEGTLRRVFLIRDRRTNDSWRYGFAEYSSVDDAQAALVRYNSFDKFTIASKPVTADYVHAGIFVPVLDMNRDSDRFTFSPLANAATKLMYWDKEAWASELTISEGPTESSKDNQPSASVDETPATADKDSKARKRKADAKEPAKQKKATPAHLQYWSDRHAELHGEKQIPVDNNDAPLEALEDQLSNEPTESIPTESFADFKRRCCWLCMRKFDDGVITSRHERTSASHRKILLDEDAVTRANVRMKRNAVTPGTVPESWIDLVGRCCYLCDQQFDRTEDTSRHENLSLLHSENLSNNEAVRKGMALLGVDRIVSTAAADPYLDPIGRCCYLCMSKFQTGEKVFRHAYTSQLHRSNLRDEVAVKAAISRVGKRHKIVPQPLPDSFIDPLSKACYLCRKQFSTDDEMEKHARMSLIHRKKMLSEAEIRAGNVRLGRISELELGGAFDTSPEYRDRAAERRQAFGTSKKISLAFGKKANNKAEDQSKEENAAPASTKGASLLGKMGWSAGERLGAQGTGMVAPIATDMYVQGVGLGAEGGKVGDAAEEAARNTKNDYSEFLERTKDKAKERFKEMS